MRELEQPFHLELEGSWIRVSEHELEGSRVFYVNFNDAPGTARSSIRVDLSGDK